MGCNSFKLKFLGRVWECGEFAFENNPAIEIVRDVEKNVIYEKPFFDFEAYGELANELEISFVRNICNKEPITIFQDNEIVWNGFVRISDVQNIFNSEKGSYKSVEVVDGNYNLFFESNGNRNIWTSWDYDCRTFDAVEPKLFDVWEPASPGTIYQRFMFPFPNVLDKAVRMVSEGTVNLISDFFTIGAGKNWAFTTGQRLAFDVAAFEDPTISWQQLSDFMLKTFRLIRFHYQIDGVQYVRIEPYEYYFNRDETIRYEYVRNLNFQTNIGRLYSTAVVGDTAEVDPDKDTTYEPFEFNSFDKESAFVSGGCGSGAELDLTLSDIVVDTDKIEIALTDGQNDKTYENTNFVIETDGISAIKYGIGPTRYYNENFLNSRVLSRWFTGLSPVTVFPAQNNAVNSFKIIDPFGEQIADNFLGFPFNWVLERLWFAGAPNKNIVWNPDNTLTTQTRDNVSVPSIPPTATEALIYTCSKAADYRVEIKWNLGFNGDFLAFNPNVLMYANVRHETNGGILIQTYTSPPVEISNGTNSATEVINYLTENITIGLNERLTFYLSSNESFGTPNGDWKWFIGSGSSVAILPCSEFLATVEAGDLNQIYNIEFDDYPICRDTFNKLRERPGLRQLATTALKDELNFGGWVESLKYDLTTGKSEVLLVSGDVPPFETPANCWVLYDCFWHDECIWFDSKIWCDS